MIQGAALTERVPGRASWEIGMVVQGGLRILQKCRAVDTLVKRPRLNAWDLPLLLLRSACMSRA